MFKQSPQGHCRPAPPTCRGSVLPTVADHSKEAKGSSSCDGLLSCPTLLRCCPPLPSSMYRSKASCWVVVPWNCLHYRPYSLMWLDEWHYFPSRHQLPESSMLTNKRTLIKPHSRLCAAPMPGAGTSCCSRTPCCSVRSGKSAWRAQTVLSERGTCRHAPHLLPPLLHQVQARPNWQSRRACPVG